ncbi:PREDICTED: regenerating islet-derived protein 3-gamma-like [Miniopterus natalensis]|uniref:regenerating islet-derived protein 3-gamma-like n=1 Tax=Miniopterus natalensis TaxID=291302 RepID=UPI0007A6CC64|nr:PREDICTED: regenerating islet-derived protein 3-gamma-like [Miniopterus natalensis]
MMLPPMALPRVSWMLLSCLMLLCQVQGEDTKEELPSLRISCPKGSYAFGSHCYAFFRTPKSWNEADLACQKRPSGFLVSVLNGAEASFLASLVKNNLNAYSYVWIGLHDPTQGYEPNAGGWEWSNDDVMNYFAWEKDPALITNPGYCGSLSRNSGYLKWKDYNCYEKLPYVCKFKG